MNVLIVYFTLSGNTAEIARAMGDHAKALGHSVDVKPLKDVAVADLDAYDVVLVGSACHDTSLARPVLDMLHEIPASSGYTLAGFATHATVMPDHPIHGDLYGWAGKCLPAFERVCAEKSITFKGYFHCQGKPSEGIAQFIHESIIPDEAEWQEYIDEVDRHPDAQDIVDAQAFVEKVLGV